jgi:arsenite methyltransferase
LTRSEAAIPGLEGLLSWISCIGDALPAEGYIATLQQAGFHVSRTEDHSNTLVEMVRQTLAKLLGAEIMAGLKRIDLPGVDLATGRQFAQAALQATTSGTLGYIVIAARKP